MPINFKAFSDNPVFAGVVTASGGLRVNNDSIFKGPNPWVDARSFGLSEGSLDNTSAVNLAIAYLGADGGEIRFSTTSTGTSNFTFTGTINCAGASALVFRGVSSAGGGGKISLVYTGTGARFIDARSTTGFKMRDLMVQYTNAAFTGSLIDLSSTGIDSQLFELNNCFVGGVGAVGQTAILVNLDKANDGKIIGGNYVGGGYCIKGVSTTHSNSHQILGVRFASQAIAAIFNAGQGWLITCDNEGGIDGAPRLYDGDKFAGSVTFLACWAGDSSLAGTLIDFNGAALTVLGCNFDSGLGAPGGTCVLLGSRAGMIGASGAQEIKGNSFINYTNPINLGSNSFGGDIGPNAYTNCTKTVIGTRSKDTKISDGDLPVLSSTAVSISTGWGSAAAVTSITGVDNSFVVVVQSSGAGMSTAVGFNNFIQVAFTLPFQTAPQALVSKSNSFAAADVATSELIDTSTAAATIYWPGLPTAGRFYGFRVKVGP